MSLHSYKEESPDETDSDDVVEVQEKEIENENAECIDRVMDIRVCCFMFYY